MSINGYGGNNDDQILSQVIKTTDSGFIIVLNTGSDSGSGNVDSFCYITRNQNIFLKFNPEATLLNWSKCFSAGTSFLFPTDNDSFICIGVTNSVPSGWAFKISKTDNSENTEWIKTFGGEAASAILECALSTKDGAYIMAGEVYFSDTDFTSHYGSNSNADIALIKVDSNGNKIWTNVIGGTGEDEVAAIVQTPDNGCYIVGYTESYDYDCTGNHSYGDAYLARIAANGSVLWHRDLGGSNIDRATNAVSDGKGGVLISAYTYSSDYDITRPISSGGVSFWVIDVDSNNAIVWDNCYGGGGHEQAFAICKSLDGTIWVAGSSTFKGGEVDTSYGEGDAWIVRADSVGNFMGEIVLGEKHWDQASMIYALADSNIMIGGFYNGPADSSRTMPANWYGNGDAFIAVIAPDVRASIPDVKINSSGYDVFPNPANTYVNIQVNSSILPCNLIISNSIGTDVSKNILYAPNNKISIKNLPIGIYYLKIIDSRGNRFTEKMSILY